MDNWRCSHGWLRGEQCEICNALTLEALKYAASMGHGRGG